MRTPPRDANTRHRRRMSAFLPILGRRGGHPDVPHVRLAGSACRCFTLTSVRISVRSRGVQQVVQVVAAEPADWTATYTVSDWFSAVSVAVLLRCYAHGGPLKRGKTADEPVPHYIAADPGAPPDDWPHYGIKFVPAVKRALRKYAVFSGRAGPGEYWWWVLFVLAGWLVLGLFAALFGRLTSPDGGLSDGWGTWPFSILFVVFWLGGLVPTFAVSVRRLHDAGFSGWFYLLAFVPFASIVPVIMLFMPPSAKGAQYGLPRSPGGGTCRRLPELPCCARLPRCTWATSCT